MSQITYDALTNAKQALSPLYVIHGEEDLLRIEALDALRQRAKEQGYLTREILTVDNHFDWSEIWSSLNSMGLFADKKLLEIHIPSGKPGKEGGAALSELPQHLNDETVVVIFLPKLESATLKTKWFSILTGNAKVLDAKAITTANLPDWIRSRLAQHQLKIEPEALDLFAQRVEGNLLAARQEIDKLALIHPPKTVLTLKDTEEAIANVARFDVFQLASSWMNGDINRLQHILDGLEAEGNEPILLLWAVSEDLRTLIRLKGAFSQGQTVASVRTTLRLWGDKQVIMPKAAKQLSVAQLMHGLQQCCLADKQIKGAADGNAWQTVRSLLIDLAKTFST